MENKEQYEDQVEGRNAVLELIESGKDINKIYIEKGEKQGSINKILAIAKERKILVTEIDKQKFKNMCQTPNAQGIIAIIPPFDYCDVYDIIDFAKDKKEDAFIIVLDGIEDPHNLGSIIRTAETVGAHGVVIPKRRAASVNSTVAKVSCRSSRTYENCKSKQHSRNNKNTKKRRNMDLPELIWKLTKTTMNKT